MRVLAFDPGYDRLGIAVIEKKDGKEILLHSDCITTSSKDVIEKRLVVVGNAVQKSIETYAPSVVAVEDVFFSVNKKTAIDVAMARGIIVYEAAKANITVHTYNPSQIKTAITGYGKSTKQDIITMLPKLISIQKEIKLDDEYDAIAVGLTCLAIERGF